MESAALNCFEIQLRPLGEQFTGTSAASCGLAFRTSPQTTTLGFTPQLLTSPSSLIQTNERFGNSNVTFGIGSGQEFCQGKKSKGLTGQVKATMGTRLGIDQGDYIARPTSLMLESFILQTRA